MAIRFKTEKRIINGNLKLLILRPRFQRKPKEKTPGILWIHGGGFCTGDTWMIHLSRGLNLVRKYGAVIVSPSYRLSTVAPYPAAFEDCYEALKYLKDHADELGINPNQIMVGGESAGGNLAAAVCMCARDKGDVNVAFQMPLYPMLDNQDTESSRDNHGPSWDTEKNHAAWKQYLAGVQEPYPVYAVPARQTDYTNLPPAYTFIGDKEPFYCETMTFVKKLQEAGVPVSVDVYPTDYHAFDMLPSFSKMRREAIDNFEKQYLYATEHYFAPQPDTVSDI